MRNGRHAVQQPEKLRRACVASLRVRTRPRRYRAPRRQHSSMTAYCNEPSRTEDIMVTTVGDQIHPARTGGEPAPARARRDRRLRADDRASGEPGLQAEGRRVQGRPRPPCPGADPAHHNSWREGVPGRRREADADHREGGAGQHHGRQRHPRGHALQRGGHRHRLRARVPPHGSDAGSSRPVRRAHADELRHRDWMANPS